MLHAVHRRGSYSVPREKRAATKGPIREKRVLLGWALSRPPGICVRLCLSGLGAAGSACFFGFFSLQAADPRTELLSGSPMIYVWWAVLFLQFRFYPHLPRPNRGVVHFRYRAGAAGRVGVRRRTHCVFARNLLCGLRRVLLNTETTLSVDTSHCIQALPLVEVLVSNAHGNRVANELGRRGYVTVQIRKNLLSALHRQSDTPISDALLFISQRIHSALWKALMMRS